jgi:hypothetical protein
VQRYWNGSDTEQARHGEIKKLKNWKIGKLNKWGAIFPAPLRLPAGRQVPFVLNSMRTNS